MTTYTGKELIMKNTMLIITSILVLSFWGCEEEPDTTPPDISIASPVDGAVVSDTITIKTVVADNDRINNVEFYLDGDLLATVSEEPFQTEWNTSESSNGEHTLQCKAVDNSDNETLSESIQVTVANALFTANFTNDWLCADCGEGIIFISDMDGNVLAEATWTGNASFEIEAPEDLTEFPDKISVTTVTRPWEGSSSVILMTNLDIPVGSSWTWGKDYPEVPDSDIATAEFSFQNIPTHTGYVFAKTWNTTSGPELYTPYDLQLRETPTNIYLKLKLTDSDHKYIWLNDITGGSYQIDLSNMSETESQTIDLQGDFASSSLSLFGIVNPGNRYSAKYRIYDEQKYTTVNAMSVHYPPSTFTDYYTRLTLYDNENSDDYWYQSVYGGIPNSFDKIDADFDFISTSPNNFQISTTSTNFDQIRSIWKQETYDYYSSWYLYGSADFTSYSLPTFPNSVIEKYPDLDNDLFELYRSDLVDHSELNSYYEILDILFNSPDLFYNVVNDVRIRGKYYLTFLSSNIGWDFEIEDEYFEMQHHR